MLERQKAVLDQLLKDRRRPMQAREWRDLWVRLLEPMLGQMPRDTSILLRFIHTFQLYRWPHIMRDIAHIIAQDYQRAVRVLLGLAREEEYVIPPERIATTLREPVELATKLASARREAVRRGRRS